MTAAERLDPGQPPDPGASIWREGAFVRLWTASSISYVGSFITRTALPLAAIYVLGAGPLEISALRSFELVGWLLVGLVAGAWVDRLRRRPIMIVADVGRAVLLGSIPIAAIGGILSLAQLIVVAFLAAILSTFFNSASTAYLPTIVARTRLMVANSALSASASAAEFTGFALSGFLVQLLTAPIAIAIDAISFVVSAVLLASIRRREPPRPAVADREPVLHEIREGVRVVTGSPVLRALAAAHAATHIMWGVFGTTYLLFATREVGLGPAGIGIVAALGGIGSLVGATVAPRLAARLGIGRTMILGLVGMTIGNALIPLAPSGAVLVGAAFLITQQLVGDSAGTIYDVVERSLTQSIVEGRILGRVNATVEFVTTLFALVGSIGGGLLAEVFGLRAALAVGVLGAGAAVLFVWRSPVRSMERIPHQAELLPVRSHGAPPGRSRGRRAGVSESGVAERSAVKRAPRPDAAHSHEAPARGRGGVGPGDRGRARRVTEAADTEGDIGAETPATRAVAAANIPHRVVRIEPARTAEEAAERQGIPLRALLRTIVVRRGDDDYLFVLVPAGRRFDWPKLRAHLGVSRMSLPDADEAESVTGYVRYTITPFGSTRAWPVIADATVMDEPLVAIGGGAFGVNLHLAPADLVRALRAQVVDVTQPEGTTPEDPVRP